MQGIRIYQPPIDADDEGNGEHARILADAIPFSIIGSTEDVKTSDGRIVKGREYLWGVAEGISRILTVAISFLTPYLQLKMRVTVISGSCARF